MGDMADMALSETLDMEDLRFEYRFGSMSDIDAYDLGIIDDRGYYNHVPMFSKNKSKTCRMCGCEGLHWESTQNGWRLADSNGIHKCKF